MTDMPCTSCDPTPARRAEGRAAARPKRALVLNLGALSVTGGIERYCLAVHRALLQAGIRTVSLSLWDDPAGAESPGGFYVGCGRSKARFARHLLALLLRHRPDVIWLGHVLLLPLVPLVRLLRPRARVVVVGYGYEVWERLPVVQRFWLRRTHRVVAISRFTGRHLAATQGVPADRIAVIPPAVPPALVPPPPAGPEREHSRRAPPRVLTVARLGDDAETKGLFVAIRSFRRVLAEFPAARYAIVGDGPARRELEEHALRLGVRDRIDFLGHVSEEALRGCYAASDVFLLPSRKEGFGIVFAEAMLHARPVVAGSVDAAAEVVRQGETGLVVDPTREVAVARAVRRLLRDPACARRMGEAGRERVLAHFTAEHFARHVAALLAELDGPVRRRHAAVPPAGAVAPSPPVARKEA
ncbi:MAG: glycosyltransferase family 4 protein [Planctomycetes bacterium]|nr:glycosyltransferase family 4 protein [Planctomycetota bacterium]